MLASREVAEDDRHDRFAPAVLAAANIHPVTRLATDYLNHFNDIVMVLELIADMPDCRDDVLAWRPMSYPAYFAASHFRERDLAIAAYASVDPALRERFEDMVAELDATVIEARDVLEAGDAADPETGAFLASLVFERLKPLISELGGLINGSAPPAAVTFDLDAPEAQDEIDRLFD